MLSRWLRGRVQRERGTFANGKYSMAERLHSAWVRHAGLEDDVVDELLRAAGINPEAPEAWPLTDVTFDYYDNSFEFKGVTVGWEAPPDFKAKWHEMGFSQCWLCYEDGTEAHHAAEGAS